jgi:hypothetical protein
VSASNTLAIKSDVFLAITPQKKRAARQAALDMKE